MKFSELLEKITAKPTIDAGAWYAPYVPLKTIHFGTTRQLAASYGIDNTTYDSALVVLAEDSKETDKN